MQGELEKKYLIRDPFEREEAVNDRSGRVPSWSPSKVKGHETAVQQFAKEKGVNLPSLQPKYTKANELSGSAEFLPAEEFVLNRPRNTPRRGSTDLALTDDEIKNIFTGPTPEELEIEEGSRREETHIAHILPAERIQSNFVDSSAEGGPVANRGIIGNPLPSRASNPSGFRGGTSGTELIKSKARATPDIFTTFPKEGGWAVPPPRKEWVLPTNIYRLENFSAFLNALTPDELALNAARQEPDFRINDFAREKGWSINDARRFQTEFNKKIADWKEAGVNPDMIAASDSTLEEQNTR